MPPRRPKPNVPKDPIISYYDRFLSNTRLDENGNPYMETSFSAQSNLPEWTRIDRRRPLPKKQLIGGAAGAAGALTLKCLVRRFLNGRLDDLTVEALRRVEWSIMKVVWEDALLSSRDSFHAWSTFAAVYGDETDFRCHARAGSTARMRREKLSRAIPLHSMIAPISNARGTWIVHLNLHHCDGYSRDDLLGIPEILNLGALGFSYNQNGTRLDDGIIRSWCRSAAHLGKLSMLKVLILRNHQGVTARSLEFLAWIEGLEVVELTGCLLDGTKFHSVKPNGWVRDYELAQELEKDSDVVEVMKGCQGDAGRRKLVLQIGDMAPRGAKNNEFDCHVFRRDRKSSCEKRKAVGGGRGTCLPAKKPTTTTVRDSRMKDMGDLLAEFGSKVKSYSAQRKGK